jgi:phosphoribosylformylglycinamidine synthase
MKKVYDKVAGAHPEVDFAKELALWDFITEANKAGLLQSAKDVNVGGIAISAAKMSVVGGKGINITIPLKDTKDIFSESLSRAIVEVRYEDEPTFETFVGQNHVECTKIGKVGGDEIFINGIKKDLTEAKNIYFNRFQEIVEQDL